jgi:hypothetical protein
MIVGDRGRYLAPIPHDHGLPDRVIPDIAADADPGTGLTTPLTSGATSGYDDVTGVGTPTGRYLDSYGAQQPASSGAPERLRRGPGT